jgi:NitT/TauT family transport system ATP-binding protein
LISSSEPRRPLPTNAAAAGLPLLLEDVRVSFAASDGRLTALDRLSIEIAAGSFTVVIGPNGCGKSTVLRVVAGLLTPESGRVVVGAGTAAASPRAGDGRVGLAFQQPRLVAWLSTLENVALPLSLAGMSAAEQRERAGAALARVGLADVARLRPRELSGGMAQRAGLARSLITDPPVLLLDEPFAALDALTREAFDTELQRLWLERPRTVVLVTHSVSEAIRLADRIVIMTARPGAVARVVPVDLARPRPAELTGDRHAAGVAAAVRATLAEVDQPELAPWVEAGNAA